jgi:hypothetical protein
VSGDGVPVTLGTIDASAQGIDQITWFPRPSKVRRSQSQAKDWATVTSLDRLPPSVVCVRLTRNPPPA